MINSLHKIPEYKFDVVNDIPEINGQKSYDMLRRKSNLYKYSCILFYIV